MIDFIVPSVVRSLFVGALLGVCCCGSAFFLSWAITGKTRMMKKLFFFFIALTLKGALVIVGVTAYRDRHALDGASIAVGVIAPLMILSCALLVWLKRRSALI